MLTHNFAIDLAAEKTYDKFWIPHYKNIFRNALKFETVTDIPSQKLGIDRIVHYNHKIIKTQDKLRLKNYNDFCFELWSDEASQKLGWSEQNLDCDILLYGIYPADIVYYFNWETLKSVWTTNRIEWIAKYLIPKPVLNYSNGSSWHTRIVAVPMAALNSKIDIRVSEVQLKFLPIPITTNSNIISTSSNSSNTSTSTN